jgi:iron complex outermembrane receptor protein
MLVPCLLRPTPAATQGTLELEPPPVSSEMVLFQEIPSVYGASRFEQSLLDAPARVSIVTAADIKHFGYRTLADVLRSVTGFYTSYDRNYSYLGVRGFARPGDYNTRVLLIIDGHRINDNVFDQAPIGTELPFDIDLVDHIEIIRGPSSSIYGTSAFFGVINVVTRQGRDLKGFEVSSSAASHDSYQGRATYGNRFANGLEVFLSGTYFDSQGQDLYFKEYDRRRTNRGVAVDCDDDQVYSSFAKMAFGDFTLEGIYGSREKGIPTGAYETVFNDPSNRTADERAYVDLRYNHKFSHDLGLLARAYYDHYDYDGDYLYNYAAPRDPPDLVLYKDYSRGDWVGGEVQVSKRILGRHLLIGGGEYRHSIRADQGAYDERPYYQWFEDKRDAYNWAAYVQDEFKLSDRWVLNAGLRYDYYDTFGGNTNPRVALIFKPREETALKLLYGTAFRAPNAYESYYADDVTTKANPNLKPEKIHTYEAAWEQFLGENLRLSASAYYYRIEDLISLHRDPDDDLLVFWNLEEVEAKGMEIELSGKWAGGWEGRVGYAYQEAKDSETGEIVTNSPRHQVKCNVVAPLYRDKLFAGGELWYLSDRITLARERAGDAVVTNLTLSARNLFKGLELSATLYNLFDVDYGDPGSTEHRQDIIDQDGRTFRVKLTYAF